MFYVSAMTPMPDALMGVQEVCHPCNNFNGMGRMALAQDPTAAAAGGAILPIIGAVQTILGVSPAQQLQKEQEKEYHAALLEQKREAATSFAQSQAEELAAPSKAARSSQLFAMYAIGGVAAIATISILIYTIKKRK